MPRQEKGGVNLPGSQGCAPYAIYKKGGNKVYLFRTLLYPRYISPLVFFAAFLSFLRCFHNYKCYIHATFSCFYRLLLISCYNCSKTGKRILANKISFLLRHQDE
ncbi:MAG: hypothetical protein D3914_10310 [Candidatus Electrothrix sp. LOE2]|nr:hypothetical protein [Candidatus Electrothrix sp. LOE2]